MRITGFESNEMILAEYGRRIKDARISMNYTQEEMAEKSGIALSTLSRIERGESVNVEKIMNVLRVLGVLSNLELMIQEQEILPTDLADKKTKRKRVSRSGSKQPESLWVWGDEKS